MSRLGVKQIASCLVLGAAGLLFLVAKDIEKKGYEDQRDERRARHAALYHRFKDQDIDESLILELQLGKDLKPYLHADVAPHLKGLSLDDYFAAAKDVTGIRFRVDPSIGKELFDPLFSPSDRMKGLDLYESLDSVLHANDLHVDVVRTINESYVDVWPKESGL